MVERPNINNEGIIETNMKFTSLQRDIAIEAIKNYFKNHKYVKGVDVGKLSFCGKCDFPYEIACYIRLDKELGRKLDGMSCWDEISPCWDREGEMEYDYVMFYWQRDDDYNSWYLSKVGKAPCGSKLNNILEGKGDYSNCPCPAEYKDNVCKPITRILKRVLSQDSKSIIDDIIEYNK